MIARIILGLIIIAVGYLFVWKTDIPYSLIGYVSFAEKVFSGGSRFFYKLLGVFIIFIGALVVANLHMRFLEATLGKILL